MELQSRSLPLHVLAVAIGLTLGTTAAMAQQDVNQPQAPQQSQQDRAGSPGQQRGAAAQQAGSTEIDQLAQQHAEISTFLEALKATGMADALTDGTKYTLFAPTNEAFEESSGMSAEELMQPDNHDRLVSLLRAHIVADDVDPQLAQSLDAAQTIDGDSVELRSGGPSGGGRQADTRQVGRSAGDDQQAAQAGAGLQGGQLMVGDATVQGSPMQMGSLRVYVIDGVLESNASQTARASRSEPQDDRVVAARRPDEDPAR